MESDRLVSDWPDLTGHVQYTTTEIYWDGPCSGQAEIGGGAGHWFLLMHDAWGEDKRGRLFALYRLTQAQIDTLKQGGRGPVNPPEAQLVGWTTDIGEYIDDEGGERG